MADIYQELVHLSRLALAGRESDVQIFLRSLVKRLRTESPQAATEIDKLLSHSPTRSSPLRKSAAPRSVDTAIPVDADSRLELVRVDNPVRLDVAPIFDPSVAKMLDQVILEHLRAESLLAEGLHPTKSLLLVGPPGVGKSLTAKWLADKLDRPLLTLELSAVMSSYLGKTGNNLRFVLDYAKSLDCVLLLDELDAVAKRRDDDADVGELKRLVTVLLQEIDAWPSGGLLVAATNHPELLDPAAWRRFEMVVEMPMPNPEQILQMVDSNLSKKGVGQDLIEAVAASCAGMSYSDIDRELRRIHREAVIAEEPMKDFLVKMLEEKVHGLSRDSKKSVAEALLSSGKSIRKTHELTGLHRKTVTEIQKSLLSKSKKE